MAAENQDYSSRFAICWRGFAASAMNTSRDDSLDNATAD